ncbi:Tripartite motif-containing protein 35 [Anabarilius grahami]|uniref:Tripartite motif-containing protein 35 n=1 Tax=Anabarilius grahami TaxID=495550 RepID=A0A3N0YDD3_ANAGA|nr:Tripartite motif-containing protein 35 [Anabarilius grahami]
MDKVSRKKATMGIFGKSGDGKSSLLNAVLEKMDFLPSGSYGACTAIITQVEANLTDSNYIAEIELFSKEEWEKELKDLFKVLSDENEDMDDDLIETAVEKITALYGADAEKKTLEELKKDDKFAEIETILSTTKKTISNTDVSNFTNDVASYTQHSESSPGGWYWPLVKSVTIKIPDRHELLEHVVLVDIPGTGDCNKIRDDLWKSKILNTDNDFQVFTVSSHAFFDHELNLEHSETEIPKLQDDLRILNKSIRRELTRDYVNEAKGVLSLIQSVQLDTEKKTAEMKASIHTELKENLLQERNKLNKSLFNIHDVLEQCLSKGVEKSVQSCVAITKDKILHNKDGRRFHQILQSLCKNGGCYLSKNWDVGLYLDLNKELAKNLHECLEDDFNKIFPVDVKTGKSLQEEIDKFSVIQSASAHPRSSLQRHIQKYIRAEETKLKAKLNREIVEIKTEIYSSIQKTIKKEMASYYEEAAAVTGIGSMKKRQEILISSVDKIKHDMFNNAKKEVLKKLNSLKKEHNTALKSLQEKLEHKESIKGKFEKTVEHIKSQAELTEQQIKQQFEKLHQFLRDEEEATITALREEEEQKKQMMKETLEEMNRHISALSHSIKDMEEMMKANDVCFLKEFPVSVERVQSSQPDPQMPSGALIHVPRYLGNLPFRVWKKMQDIVQNSPVILDPNTANPRLVMSDDLTSVKWSENKQPFPDNPERFDIYECVLGSEGFNSGTHCWDVEVKESSAWSLGVTTASNHRKGWDGNTDVWWVQYGLGERFGFPVEQKLDCVRVDLDYDRGMVSFSDPVTKTHLHTFTATFTDTVFPFFYTLYPLRILPDNSQ